MRSPAFAYLALVLTLASSLASMGPVVGADGDELRGLLIPYPEAGNDTLWMVPRSWEVTPRVGGPGVDLEGRAANPDDGALAFRLLSDIAALEGVLTVPKPNGIAEPLAHVGVRWDRIVFDPPIEFSNGRTLSAVTPGALTWSEVNATAPVPVTGGLPFMVWTSIPIPTNGTEAPDPETAEAGHELDADPDAWLVWWASFVADPESDPDVGVRSPAIARFGAGVWLDAGSVVDVAALHATEATFAVNHDFGAVARGVAATGDAPQNVTGIYLERAPTYSTGRALDTAHGWGDNASAAGLPASVLTQFSVPSYGRAPTSDPRSLFSPITLELTVPLVANTPNATTWQIADAPLIHPDGHGILVHGETGFFADEPLVTRSGTDPAPPDPGDNDTSGEMTAPHALLGFLVAAGVVLALGRRARR